MGLGSGARAQDACGLGSSLSSKPGEKGIRGKGREQEACLERLQGSRAGRAEQDLKRQMGRQTREARDIKRHGGAEAPGSQTMPEQNHLKGPDTGRQGPDGAAGRGKSPLELTVVGSTGALRAQTLRR